jgi:hypothetical protein
MYKLTKAKDFLGNQVQGLIRTSDSASIPFDPANTDYIAYLKWIEEGNVPTPADE